MLRRKVGRNDDGLISPAIAIVVVAFVFLSFGLLQVGLSADRSGRVQVAADAAALAAASAVLAPGGAGTPSNRGVAGSGGGEGAARTYAMRNLPGLKADGVKVTVEGREVTVEIRDRYELSTSPLGDLPLPDNRASATATVDEKCDDDATPADAGTPCSAPRYIAKLVE